MKIGFDAQSLQTENSKNRGIGRYTKNLINAILKIDSTNSFKIFMNDLYKDKIDLIENKNTKTKMIDYTSPSSSTKYTVNEIIQFLNYHNSKLDILHIMSTAESYASDLPVTNTYVDRLNAMVCTTIYDFIPLHFPEHYFSNSNFKKEYFRQLKTLYHSDKLFAISESTRIDAVNMLGIDPRKVITIHGGTSKNFFKLDGDSKKEINQIKKKFSIKKRFVLYTGGIEFRKNIEKSIIAFSKIGKELLEDTSYVIVCEILEPDKKRLNELAQKHGIKNNVIFTNYIPDKMLNVLYNCCDVFIFPSLIEGLGIPVLEAMKCEAPVIGSNSSSIAELIKEKQFIFEPNEHEMASLIIKVLTDEEFKRKCIKNAIKQSGSYSWENSAQKVLTTYNSLEKELILKKSSNFLRKPKVAFFSPLPPKKSGIANYSSSILKLLSRYWNIDLFIDEYSCSDPYLTTNFKIHSYLNFEQLHQKNPYDVIVYQIGNSENHAYMFDLVKKYPGIVVLHDVYLSGVLHWITAKVGKVDEFKDEVIYSHGEYGKQLVEKAQKGLMSWHDLIQQLQVNKRFLENATQIIVHSQWDKENILKQNPQFSNKISLVHQFSPLRVNTKKLESKIILGFSKDDFLICSFGFVVSTKKIDSVITNLKTFLQKNKNCKYIVVGDASDPYGQQVKSLVKKLGISDRVIFTDFIDDITYNRYLEACDVCISLRTNTRAGTSATVNHSLGAGLPTIISDEEAFNNIPNDVLIKIKPNEEKNLGKILEELYMNPGQTKKLCFKTRTYAEENLSLESCVEKYVKIVAKHLDRKTKSRVV